MKVELSLAGTEELERGLARLATGVRERLVHEALMAAGEPIRQEASSRAPRRTGTLSRNIIIAPGGKHEPSVLVGLGKHGWYGRLIERGTAARSTRGGARRGQVAARPFLRPALEARKGEARERFRDVIRRGLGLD